MSTIRDVAQAAEVSIATVSRVLNGSPRVSEDARERVWAAADRLDYWPNTAARSLTTRRSQALGVLLPDLYGEFFSEVIRGIDVAARDVHLQVLISSSHANTKEVLTAARAMRGRIDGLIIMAPDEGSIEPIHRIARRFPVLLLNPRSPVEGCSSVSVDNFSGSRALVEHLMQRGHRRIAIVKGPEGNLDAEDRLRGYHHVLAAAGVGTDAGLELDGDFTESSGFLAGARILAMTERPTAVFAANDSMAIGMLRAFRERGVRVPEDIAVSGFDDIAIASYLNPALTTVHVDAFELGRRAVHLLLPALATSAPLETQHEILPAPIIVRESCGSRAPWSVASEDGAPAPVPSGRRSRS